MDKQPAKATIGAADRAEIFHEQYGNDFDAANALPDFIIAAGDYISRIVGESETDAGMAIIISGLANAAGVIVKDPSQWRTALMDARSNCYSEWKIGPQLHDLAAYAEYGIVLHDSEDADELGDHLLSILTQAKELLAKTPVEQWGLAPNNELSRLVSIASNRWALDNGEPVEPSALAHFGGISEGRIRNLMSGENRVFTAKDGKVPAADALKWLSGRPTFWNSIWREQSLPLYTHDEPTSPLEQAAFVPVARDGSMFHPALRRGSSFTIGRKGAEVQINDFHEALKQLQQSPTPYWRRPNESGNWGTVAGIRWERVDLAHSPQAWCGLSNKEGVNS
jgi:hypothetical protein